MSTLEETVVEITKPKKPKREPLIPLAKALRLLAADPETAWMPHSTIRTAVAEGKVFSRRTPAKKFARYYVRLSDLKRLFERTKATSQ
jgi:hypothetical protein